MDFLPSNQKNKEVNHFQCNNSNLFYKFEASIRNPIHPSHDIIILINTPLQIRHFHVVYIVQMHIHVLVYNQLVQLDQIHQNDGLKFHEPGIDRQTGPKTRKLK